jgi:hypothetical protein
MKVKNLPEFDDWLHVIFDLIVVKVYTWSTNEKMKEFKKAQLTFYE